MTSAPAPIYLDYAATTPVDARVLSRMLPYFSEVFGNTSSSDHLVGHESRQALEQAREEVASFLGVATVRVVFTATATEAINIGIQGVVRRLERRRKARVLVSPVEHSAVLETCRALQDDAQADLHWLQVDSLGRLDLEALEHECRQGADLLCVQAANNEIGNVNPLGEIASLAAQHDVLLFSDITQACGKLSLDLDALRVPMAACSAHKLYGPKGVGALIVPSGDKPMALLHGGGQEGGLRPGTVNLPAVIGFAEACRLRSREMAEDELRVASLRDAFECQLRLMIPDVTYLGDHASRVAGISALLLPNGVAEAVLARCRRTVAISTGAACTRGTPGPSHVVLALGINSRDAEGFLRVSLGTPTTTTDIQQAVAAIAAAVADTRAVLRR